MPSSESSCIDMHTRACDYGGVAKKKRVAVKRTKKSTAAAELAAKRWEGTTAGERSAAASLAASARWAGKPPVKCKGCGAPCPSIRAARAHCR